ncbi:MAG: MoxR family ATPase, partial [Candidatus Eremiobacteraeota bacterium]|nr:MoxR family ATPase [Candidatus Eremiobacteraeota bacterium]
TVTVDGRTLELSPRFTVIATQNPIEQQGTYPLPEAQLDRFLFKIVMDYPDRDQEIAIVGRHGNRSAMPHLADFGLSPVADLDRLRAIRQAVAAVTLTEPIIEYVVDLVRGTREHTSLEVGASPRAATMLAAASRAVAVLRGRDFVIPDDVKELVLPTLRHRVVASASAEIEGLSTDRILRQTIERTSAPR